MEIWKRRYEELVEQVKDFLTAIKKVPELVKNFLASVLWGEQSEPTRTQKQREKATKR